MKQLVVISGKGGTGKTSIVASLAHLAASEGPVTTADCDVDAANLALLLSGEDVRIEPFWSGQRARIDADSCTLCGLCAEQCRAAAIRIGDWIRRDGHRTVGLAGGSTPRLTYEFLRAEDLPWEQTHLWLTDERHVPMDHPESNGGMVLESLVSHVPARFHAVDYHEDAAVAAAGYERTLHEMWRSVGNQQQLGLMLLGVGGDGHTASLFPGTVALDERDRDYVANWVNDKCAWRLTATPSLLAQADQLVFLVAGEAKAPVVKEILEQDSNHPAAIVSRAADDPVWMLDRAAASCLGGGGHAG